MSAINQNHRRAMALLDQAAVEERNGRVYEALSIRRDALHAAREAAMGCVETDAREPSLSILFHSAATIALMVGDHDEAARLAEKGLGGTPPSSVAADLRAVLEQAQETAGSLSMTTDSSVAKADRTQAEGASIAKIPREWGETQYESINAAAQRTASYAANAVPRSPIDGTGVTSEDILHLAWVRMLSHHHYAIRRLSLPCMTAAFIVFVRYIGHELYKYSERRRAYWNRGLAEVNAPRNVHPTKAKYK